MADEPRNIPGPQESTVTALPAEDTAKLDGFTIVGVGASAGGVEAFSDLLRALPVDTGMAFVLVLHLDPHHESVLASVLGNRTEMPVIQVEDGTRVRPNEVYVIPPNTNMRLKDGVLGLTPRVAHEPHNPIDAFLISLADVKGPNAIGVVLSGTASDGTLGLKSIKAAAGITFVQDLSAKFDSMPRNAIEAGVVDFILTPQQIAAELVSIARHPYYGKREQFPPQQDGPILKKILALLRTNTSVDFTEYKQPTIQRRLMRRMAVRNSEDLEHYLALLEKEPREVDALFDDLLINVTDFFRDPETFESLRVHAFPAIMKEQRDGQVLRIWVPGCSSGEEVYSIAIMLVEYFDGNSLDYPIRLFGTDLSERIIERARTGFYPDSAMTNVSPERLRRFFTRVEGGYQIARLVREMCIFSRHNIAYDPPLSRMDLISCRNLLIYLNPSLQARVIAAFAYALKPAGCLLLGSSESVGPLNDYFTILDHKHKIYSLKLSLPKTAFGVNYAMTLGDMPVSQGTVASRRMLDRQEQQSIQRFVDRILLSRYGPTALVINRNLRIVDMHGEVRRYLNLRHESDDQLFAIVRHDLAAPLRAAVDSARERQTTIRMDALPSTGPGGMAVTLEITVIPVRLADSDQYFAILFEEMYPGGGGPSPETAAAALDNPRHIRQLEQELTSTREYLQPIIEELRSANEEAQSTNEELQSSNEELQTAKEEMQSSNEELNTINVEMQSRNAELAQLNDDLTNLLSSLNMPVLMVSQDLRIRRFTPKAETVLRLLPGDLGRPISDLQPRINAPDLEQILRQVLYELEPYEREVLDQEGNPHLLRVRPYRTSDNRIDGAVLQLVDIGELKRTLENVREARDYAQAIVDTVGVPLVILGETLQVRDANRAFYNYFRVSKPGVTGTRIADLGRGIFSNPALLTMLQDLAATEGNSREAELEDEVEGIGQRVVLVSARQIPASAKRGLLLLVAFEDITERKRAAEARYRRLFETAKDGICLVDVESGTIADVNPCVEHLFGYQRTELVGKVFWEVPPMRDLPEARQALERIGERGIVNFPDVLMHAKNGRKLTLEVIGNVYSEAGRRVIQLNMRDLTERRRFEQELQHTARLESLGLLAGGIAHDFNNLLTGIMGNASLLFANLPVGDRRRSNAQDIIRASERAAHLTRQMLAYAGKGRFVMQRLNVPEFIQDSIPLIQSSVPKSVDISLALDNDTPEIEADPGQLQQILMNLVINAAEAIGDARPGRIEVRSCGIVLTREDVEERYASDQISPGAFVLVEIKDNGSGMDESTRNRIFDPFFTTKFTGRGLGLAAVQGIVHGHRGAISVYSAPGQGSAFRVLLPAAEPAPASVSAGPETISAASGGTILLIDDEEIVRAVACSILEPRGYRVLTAQNGQQGVEVFQANKDRVRLVLLDLLMPVMDGEAALDRIRQIRPDIQVVLLSAFDEAQAIERFAGRRLNGFIQKPFKFNDLLDAVGRALQPQ